MVGSSKVWKLHLQCQKFIFLWAIRHTSENNYKNAIPQYFESANSLQNLVSLKNIHPETSLEHANKL